MPSFESLHFSKSQPLDQGMKKSSNETAKHYNDYGYGYGYGYVDDCDNDYDYEYEYDHHDDYGSFGIKRNHLAVCAGPIKTSDLSDPIFRLTNYLAQVHRAKESGVLVEGGT